MQTYTPRSDRRQLLGWIALAGVLAFAAMCMPFFLGRVYTADDLGEFHLPIRDFYSRQLAAGEPWDWMPSLFCGFYLTGEGQLGGYHPLHFLLYRTLPLGAAFNLELLLNYPFLALGTYLFLRRIVVRRDAAAFGALVFTFSSFNLLHFVHPNAIAVVAHLPWILWLVDIAVVGRVSNPSQANLFSRGRVGNPSYALCGIALLTGSQLLLGYPQYVWLSLLAEFAYAAIRLWSRTGWKRRAIELISAIAAGVLIGGVQLLPTIDALANSTRVNVDEQFRSSGSLHPLNLVQPFAPYLFATRVVGQNTHELGMYFGCVPLVLCFWLCLNRPSWGRAARIIWPTITLGTLALLYAFGEFGPLYNLQAWIPLVGNFRFPCRAIVLVELAVAVLTAIAFLKFIRAGKPSTSWTWVPAVLSVLVSVATVVAFPTQCSTPILITLGPLLILLATCLIVQVGTGNRCAAAALILLAVGDMAAYGLTYSVFKKTSNLNAFVASVNGPQGRTTGRLLTDSGGEFKFGNRLILAGYSLADGYAGLEPVCSIDRSSAASLRAANVQWMRGDQGWQRIKGVGPRAWFAAGDGTARIERDSAGAIDFRTDSSCSGTLFLSERYHAGWTARIDGQVVPVMQAEDNFISVQVPPGMRVVELRFQPASLRYGFLLTTFGLGLTMSWAVIAMRPHTSPNKEPLDASSNGPGARQRRTAGLQRSESA